MVSLCVNLCLLIDVNLAHLMGNEYKIMDLQKSKSHLEENHFLPLKEMTDPPLAELLIKNYAWFASCT